MSERKVLDMRVSGSQFKTPEHPRVSPPRVKDLIGKPGAYTYSVEADVALRDALQLIKAPTLALVVTQRERVIGILSGSDCARWALEEPSLLARSVRDSVRTCAFFVSGEDSLYDCLRAMNEHDARYAPVLDGSKAIGLVSREQVLSELVVYLERVFHEYELDQQIVFLRGTYSC